MALLLYGRFALFCTVLSWMNALSPDRDHLAAAISITTAVSEHWPIYANDPLRLRTAALVTAVSFRESGFDNDVVSETADYCMMQINRRPDLASDPVECVHVGITMLIESRRMCPAHPIAFYASGPRGCDNDRAQRISRDRSNLAAWLLAGARSSDVRSGGSFAARTIR